MTETNALNDVGAPVRPSPRQLFDLAERFIRPGDRADAKHDFLNVFQMCVKDVSSYITTDIRRANILVVGCGFHYPDVILWSNSAEEVTGVDVRTVFWRNGRSMLYTNLRSKGRGPARAIVETFYLRRGYPSYYRKLRRVSRLQIDARCQDLVSYNGVSLPFSDGSFDVVCSNAVLEHVADLRALSQEMGRVTKTGGICHHLWHNYYSLSGGHVRPHLARSKPWGHLLGDQETSRTLRFSGTFLNRMMSSEIVESLSQSFAPLLSVPVDDEHRKMGIDPGFRYEGDELLTPELKAMLSEYPREVLLTRAYLFIGRKTAR